MMAQSEAVSPAKTSPMSALNMIETSHPCVRVVTLVIKKYEGFRPFVRPVTKKPEANGLLRVHQSSKFFFYRVF